MNSLDIPFNTFIGLQRAENQDQYLLELPSAKHLQNHLGTVHASAQFSLAEACSGEFLLQLFSEQAGQIIPVVRKVETKFKKPAAGTLFARASLSTQSKTDILLKLEHKGRVIIGVEVEVCDTEQQITMTARIDWFITSNI